MIIYDLETYPNFFSCAACSYDRDDMYVWEFSQRRNDLQSLIQWLRYLAANHIDMVGFNNIGFDYPILHRILLQPENVTTESIYQHVQQIISNQDNGPGGIIWESDRLIPQIDLFKIHHFDNNARRTSLKALQFAMRAESIEELPYAPGTMLTSEQMDVTLEYNKHDVLETKRFAHLSAEQIRFRRELSATIRGDVLNFNDTKIGKQYFIQELGEDSCYERDATGRRMMRQTPRDRIVLGDIVFPYIRFERPEFNGILDWFKSHTIHNTKGDIKDVHVTVDGFRFDFGTGGIHGSVTAKAFRSTDTHEIIDVDVTSLYPSIAIVNRLYPAHLGERFVDIYRTMKERRISYKKGTPENAMLKLALNGVYGDSNNIYSPMFDPQYTMSVTINGQLLLCMLAERLMTIPGLQLIQINTDGVTSYVPRSQRVAFDAVCDEWQRYTCLELERAYYSHMWVRDVNNYLARTEDGKLKKKGAYDYPSKLSDYTGVWHKDFSALVVQIAAECALVHGVPVEQTIMLHHDPFDFCLRAKAPSGSKVYIGEREMGKITRYHITYDGEPIAKVSPPVDQAQSGWYKKANGVSWAEYLKHDPLVWNPAVHTKNQSKYEERRLGINTGWTVRECNDIRRFDWSRLNREWYVQEAKKLVDVFG